MKILFLSFLLILSISCRNINKNKVITNDGNDNIIIENVSYKKDIFKLKNRERISFANVKYDTLKNEFNLPLLKGAEYQTIKKKIPGLPGLDTASIYPYSYNQLGTNRLIGFFIVSEIGEDLFFINLLENGIITDVFRIERGKSDLIDQTEEKEIILYIEKQVKVIDESRLQIQTIKKTIYEFYKDEQLNKETIDTLNNYLTISKEGKFKIE